MKLEEADITLESYSQEAENIKECLNLLYGTIRGTFPMNRDFGIDSEALDYPLPTARVMLEIDIKNQTEKYEKRVEVEGITFSYDEEQDAIKPFIRLFEVEQEEKTEDVFAEDEVSELSEYESEDDDEWI